MLCVTDNITNWPGDRPFTGTATAWVRATARVGCFTFRGVVQVQAFFMSDTRTSLRAVAVDDIHSRAADGQVYGPDDLLGLTDEKVAQALKLAALNQAMGSEFKWEEFQDATIDN